MANILPKDKQITAISALAEGTSIRAVERITGIHQDTIGRLAVRVGTACEKLMNEKMKNLPCKIIQLDEIWGFVGKKQRNVRKEEDSRNVGDVWTYAARENGDTK